MNWRIQFVSPPLSLSLFFFFYKRILADERMQMKHINMLALLPSHFIFFPLIKKDISYVTSSLCSNQHTHSRTMWGNLRVVHGGLRHTRTHTGGDMHSNTRSLTADNLTLVAPLNHSAKCKPPTAKVWFCTASYFLFYTILHYTKQDKKKKKKQIRFTWRLSCSPFEREEARGLAVPTNPGAAAAAFSPRWLQTCANWSLPGMCSDGASLRLSAPLNPHTLPLAYSHGLCCCCLFRLWFNIQQSATCTRKHSRAVAHRHTQTHSQWIHLVSLNQRLFFFIFSVFLFLFKLSLIISGICSTMEVYCSQCLNVLASFLSYQWCYAS